MRLATWNVNSVRARLAHLLHWLEKEQPDVVLLQEIKTRSEDFPAPYIEDLGYNIAVLGQKTYNGVGILSKFPLEEVVLNLPNGEDSQARYIEAVTGGYRVCSLYVPNGQTIGSEKYFYKLQFLDRLYDHVSTLLKYGEPLLLGGDFNVTFDDNDIYDPSVWHEKIMCSTQERHYLRQLLHLGLSDVIRIHHPPHQERIYSWWDYRRRAWERNEGLRIDHILASPQAVDLLEASGADDYLRDLDRPSDHVPIWCNLRR